MFYIMRDYEGVKEKIQLQQDDSLGDWPEYDDSEDSSVNSVSDTDSSFRSKESVDIGFFM